MSSGASCVRVPLAKNGKDSKLYKDLSKKTKDRPFNNMIYSMYLQDGVADAMDSAGYKRDKNGEHWADDVYKFLGVNDMVSDMSDAKRVAKAQGWLDDAGNTVEFTDSSQVMTDIVNFNSTSKNLVASIVNNGDTVSVVVEPKNGRTILKKERAEELQKAWQITKNGFSARSVDLEQLKTVLPSIFNAATIADTITYLADSVAKTENKYLSVNDIKALLYINKDTTEGSRLITMFTDIDNAAQQIYDFYRTTYDSYSSTEQAQIHALVTALKDFAGIDMSGLKTAIDNELGNLRAVSPEIAIKDKIDELNEKYGINKNEIHMINAKIDSLSDAAISAVMALQRNLDEMVKKNGVNPESKILQATLKKLMQEIGKQQYTIGLLRYMNVVTKAMDELDNYYINRKTTGTNMEVAASAAAAITEMRKAVNGYYTTIVALTDIDKLVNDGAISKFDKKRLEDAARIIKERFDNERKKYSDLAEDTMFQLVKEILGDSLPNGVAIGNIMAMAEADASIWDFLYSMSRVSNPLVAATGTVIRNAQDRRTDRLNDVRLRIARATDKLYKSGIKDTKWMYEKVNNMIISDIDWTGFETERKNYRNRLYANGYRGLDLTEAMQLWDEEHTEDRVVNNIDGRTERVPDGRYRKPMPPLNAAQQEYYEEMMQLKGEIGSLFPSYAQKQYLPAQKRRNFMDALWEHKSVDDVWHSFKEWMKSAYKIMPDDEYFAQNGVVDGEEYGFTSGDYDNTILKRIPIFHVGTLADQKELLKDFSGGLQTLAEVAINYDEMSKVEDIVNMMAAYIDNNQDVAATSGEKKVGQRVADEATVIVKDLIEHSRNTNTSNILHSFIDQHLYGINLKETNKYVKLIKNLLMFNSIRSLSLNIKGAISNEVVGHLQAIIEAGGGEFYKMKDLLWAEARVFGDNTTQAPGRIIDFINNNENSKSVLLGRLFDPTNDMFRDTGHSRYHSNWFRVLLSKDLTFIGYGMGEHKIHFLNLYAMMHAQKCWLDGKKITLYDAFEVVNKEDGNSELKVKDGVTLADRDGNDTGEAITEGWIFDFRKKVRGVNQNTHGSMNEEDRGVINQYLLGKMAIQFKQWMIEHYSRRYREGHFDGSMGQYREGFYRTAWNFIKELYRDKEGFDLSVRAHWDRLEDWQKANIRRTETEIALIGILTTLSFALKPIKDVGDDEVWYRMFMYQVKRALMDERASTPTGLYSEIWTIIQDPLPIARAAKDLAYPITGLMTLDFKDTLGPTSPDAGENKYWRNIKKNTLKFPYQIEETINGISDDTFNIFENNDYRRK